MSERRDSMGTAGERPLQRQSQGGGLYEEAKFFLANCARSATARAEKQPLEGDVSDMEFDGDVVRAANKPVLSAMRCRMTLGG